MPLSSLILVDISAISKRGIAVQIVDGKVTEHSGLITKGEKGNIVEKE